MASLLNLCERYFGTHNFYDVLKIPKSANDKKVKKAYYKLSLLVHPDRVEDSIKAEATEKFKILGGIYSVLSDNEKRKVYDKSIQYNEKSEEIVLGKLVNYLISLLKEIITVKDINEIEMRLFVLSFLCSLLLKGRDYDESRQKEIIIRKLTNYLLFLLEDINNCEKRGLFLLAFLCLLLLRRKEYEKEVEVRMRKLTIDYLISLLEEMSTVEDTNYKKLKLFSVSLCLFLLKRKDSY